MPVVSPWKLGMDIVLFPFRLLRALVHFLDFFSRVFSKQPLITASGPRREGPDARSMMLWGKVIDAERELRKARGADAPALVPDSWQLTRLAADGSQTTLARGVVAYDVGADGRIIFTNGTSVRAMETEDVLARGALIQSVCMLPASS